MDYVVLLMRPSCRAATVEGMEPDEPQDDPIELPPRLPVRQHGPGWSVGGIIGAILGTVLIVGGLFVVAMFVLLAVGLNHWASNK